MPITAISLLGEKPDRERCITKNIAMLNYSQINFQPLNLMFFVRFNVYSKSY